MSIARKAARLFPLLLLLGSVSASAEFRIETRSPDSSVHLQYRQLAEMSQDARNAYFQGLLDMTETLYGRRCVRAVQQQVVDSVLQNIESRLDSDPVAQYEIPGMDTVERLKELCDGR